MGNRTSVYNPIDEAHEGLPSRHQTPPAGKIVTPNLKAFTLAELKTATNNFKHTPTWGEVRFGRVFKGWINEATLAPSGYGFGMPVAVQKCSLDSAQGIELWKAEVNLQAKFSHPNLVKLIGYYAEGNDRLLVSEYSSKGSLENHLFNPSGEPLPWGTRIGIAMDVARGLDFLHNNPEKAVIHRDVKPANISLDGEFGAKLSNFELAMTMEPEEGNSYVSTEVMGTYGYAAPEYIATGNLYVTSDVYGFGVVLLEILTGLRCFDTSRPSSKKSIVDTYKPILHKRDKIKKIIDPRMGEYPPEGARKLALLAKSCLELDPMSRPSMPEVLLLLERISTISIKPKKSKGSS